MSDNQKDVLIAAYLFDGIAQKDFEAVLELAAKNEITVEGVVLCKRTATARCTSPRPVTTSAVAARSSEEASASSSASSPRHSSPRRPLEPSRVA